jgi:hypothetical protein
MQNFLSQVFNDLRARRLLPVAVLLVAGLVAAPILLSKKADETPAPTPGPAAGQTQPEQPKGPDELAQVKLEDEFAEGNGSSLSAFDASNPFAPPQKVLKAARDEAQGDAGLTPLDTGGAVPGTGTGTDPVPGTGGETGGGTPDGGGDDDDGGTKTSEFTYVLDVTFWSNGRKRRIENLQKLDMLPNQAAPLLIFMGVSDNAGNAVFLVDSTLNAAGEGKCKPSRADCAFLYLGAGSEEEFTNDDGASYRLRINEIKKVKVGADSGRAASDDEASASASKSARAAVGAPPQARRFSFPTLIDYVVQSGNDTDNSTGADQRR